MLKKIIDKFKRRNSFMGNDKYPTPFFVVTKSKIIENLNGYKKCFPDSTVCYAMKANFEQEVLQTVLDAGGSFEVASKYELEMLEEIGVEPEKIIYGTAVKPAEWIKEFYDYGVRIFAFDCLSELEKISKLAPGSKVFVRVHVSEKGSVFKLSEKFGTKTEDVVFLLKKARGMGLLPYGISFHIGSQASDVNAWANGIEEIKASIIDLANEGIILETLNIGGGFPCNTYFSSQVKLSLSEISESVFTKLKTLPYAPKIMLEPGRGIIADTTKIVTTVFARVERENRIWLFLDVGVYTGLFESMVYQGDTRYRIEPLGDFKDIELINFALAGPTGDSPDVITREIKLPKNFGVGDKLIIHDVGAYSLPTVSPFHGFPKPTVYYI